MTRAASCFVVVATMWATAPRLCAQPRNTHFEEGDGLRYWNEYGNVSVETVASNAYVKLSEPLESITGQTTALENMIE